MDVSMHIHCFTAGLQNVPGYQNTSAEEMKPSAPDKGGCSHWLAVWQHVSFLRLTGPAASSMAIGGAPAVNRAFPL